MMFPLPHPKAEGQKAAHELNNMAATLIETGKLDEAITVLKVTLDSVKQCEYEQDTCKFNHCSLDECIVASQLTSRKLQTESTVKSPIYSSIIHKRPIRINCDQNCVGNIQSIVTFNIALTHHLKAAVDFGTSNSKTIFTRTLSLYHLVHEMQRNCAQGPSIYLEMILLGNIGHIHHVLKNKEKCNLCLKQLSCIETIVSTPNHGRLYDQIDQVDASFKRPTVFT